MVNDYIIYSSSWNNNLDVNYHEKNQYQIRYIDEYLGYIIDKVNASETLLMFTYLFVFSTLCGICICQLHSPKREYILIKNCDDDAKKEIV